MATYLMYFITPIPAFPHGRAERQKIAWGAILAKEPDCRAGKNKSFPPLGETGKGVKKSP